MAKVSVVRAPDGDAKVYKYAGHEIPCLFKAGKLSGSDFDLLVMDVGYLDGPPLHTHETQFDSFYVLEGVLTLKSGGELIELHPGDFASVPPTVPHTFDNLHEGQGVVKVLDLMTPAGFDAHIAEADELAKEPDNVYKMEQLNKKYGTAIVGMAISEEAGLR